MSSLIRFLAILAVAGLLCLGTSSLISAQVSSLEAVFQAFTNGDYLQAIDLAKGRIKPGEDSTPNYFILGASYYKLDKFSEAELYLKQAISIIRGEERMKQSARLYLCILRESQYQSSQNSTTRSNLADAAQDFLRSNLPTFLSEDQNTAVRKLANDMLIDLTNISGEWGGNTIDNDSERFVVEKVGEHRYRITKEIRPGQIKLSLSGIVNETSGGVFSGTLKHTVMDIEGNRVAMGEQSVTVTLRLSEDTTTLSGTADYGEMRDQGNILGIYPRVFKAQTIQFTLKR